MSDAEKTKKLIASRLSIARKQAGLSQAQVAQLLSLPRPSVSEIETGGRRVAADELVRFADLYQVDINWLVGKGTEGVDPMKDRLLLAAREVANFKREDLDKVIDLLISLKPKDDN